MIRIRPHTEYTTPVFDFLTLFITGIQGKPHFVIEPSPVGNQDVRKVLIVYDIIIEIHEYDYCRIRQFGNSLPRLYEFL